MAKDGSMRGGQRAGAGRKSKSLNEKITTGNPGGRKLKVIELPDAPDLQGEDMPEPREFLKAKQKAGGEFEAESIYKETWEWLKKRNVEKLINKQTLEQYSIAVSRWIQCETAISDFGFLAKHPTTGAPIASPYVSMAQQYQKQASAIWYGIFQVVKENNSSDLNDQDDDPMARMLKARGGL